MVTSDQIMSTEFPRLQRLNEEVFKIKKDGLVDRNCGRLDGNCQCQRIEECIYYREDNPKPNP